MRRIRDVGEIPHPQADILMQSVVPWNTRKRKRERMGRLWIRSGVKIAVKVIVVVGIEEFHSWRSHNVSDEYPTRKKRNAMRPPFNQSEVLTFRLVFAPLFIMAKIRTFPI
jgi:hypothetical protein